MIGNAVKKMLMEKGDHFLVSDENVAYVMAEHPLNHALLVLTKVGYSKIPVLDKENRLVGLISLSAIVNQMFDVTEIDPDNLIGLKVGDVMERDVVALKAPFDVEDILHLLVDHPFLPVIDEYQHFKGILTRKQLLKAVNHLAHELETEYEVIPRAQLVARKA